MGSTIKMYMRKSLRIIIKMDESLINETER